MSRLHIFFESLEAWVAASGTKPVYTIPMQITRPASNGLVWKESKIQLSQEHDDTGAVHHCLFLIGRYLEPIEQHEKQEHAERLDHHWQQLNAWLKRNDYSVIEGMLSFPEYLTTIDAYLPKSVTEAHNAPDAAANAH